MNAAKHGEKYLTPQEASKVYDRIGRFQDWQSFYEAAAIKNLIAHGNFDSAKSVIEFGCGTGAFAATLLRYLLPQNASYVGIDVSPKMNDIARSRLQNWTGRVKLIQSDGSAQRGQTAGHFDRFVSNYVFDLLSPQYATEVLSEAWRLLATDGRLCLVSLTNGTSRVGRVISSVWEELWRWNPRLVGGCRPQQLKELLPEDRWHVVHEEIVSSVGIASQVVVARRVDHQGASNTR